MEETSQSQGAPYTVCARMLICVQHTNIPKQRGKQIDGEHYSKDGRAFSVHKPRVTARQYPFLFNLKVKTCLSQSQPMLTENVTLSEAN